MSESINLPLISQSRAQHLDIFIQKAWSVFDFKHDLAICKISDILRRKKVLNPYTNLTFFLLKKLA